MRLAGSTLTFSRAPLPEAAGALARLGFTHVELAAVEGWAHVAPSRLVADFRAEAERVRAACAAAGLTPVGINAGLGATDDPAEQLGAAGAVFRLAAALGVPVVTLPAGPPGPSAPGSQAGVDLRPAVARLRPLLEEAQRQAVTLAVETHIGSLTEQPDAAAALCRALPGLRLTLDASHFWAGPAQGNGWEAAVPFVAHVHLRDAGFGGWGEIQVWPGRGTVDWAGVSAALAAAAYRGAWVVEYIDTLPVTPEGTVAQAAAEMARQARAGWPPAQR